MSRSIDDLHPFLAYAFGMACGRWEKMYPNAPVPFLTCTHRTPQEQDALYAQPFDGRDNDGDGRIDEPDEKVTNARAYESPHNFLPALAFDVAFKDRLGNPDWDKRLFDQFARLIPGNITWGGNFKSLKDLPHFELADWKTRIPITPKP